MGMWFDPEALKLGSVYYDTHTNVSVTQFYLLCVCACARVCGVWVHVSVIHVFRTVGNGCNSLNLHPDLQWFWQPCLHTKSDPLNLKCVTYTILYCVMHCTLYLAAESCESCGEGEGWIGGSQEWGCGISHVRKRHCSTEEQTLPEIHVSGVQYINRTIYLSNYSVLLGEWESWCM